MRAPPADHRYSGSMPFEKKNDRLARTRRHSCAREVYSTSVKPLARVKASCETGSRRLGDVVAGDRHRVEISDVVLDEELLHVAIILSANSVEKMQVFLAWSSLKMSACTVPRTCETLGTMRS